MGRMHFILAAGSLLLCAIPATAQSNDFAATMLFEHNAARLDVGVEPLRWNPQLADEAQDWADDLARRGVLEHATFEGRNGMGENLWAGTSHYFTFSEMIEAFVDERRYYRHGEFPAVSTTGNWSDVGHYTQIVWRDTREVGCALAEGRHNEYLVCRYFPAGNVTGQRAY